MVNYHAILVSALKTVLPAYYEMTLHSDIPVPCISYMEINNYASEQGETVGYSRLTYQIKIWGYDIEQLQTYALQVDEVLRLLGWKRTVSGELYDNNSTMIQKILTYEALASEKF